MTTFTTPFDSPAPPQVLSYADCHTPKPDRQRLIRVLAIIVVMLSVVYAVAWMAEYPNHFVSDAFRDLMRVYVPYNMGAFLIGVSAGGLIACYGRWIQLRPIENRKFFIVLLLIHASGLSLGIIHPERPHRALGHTVFRPGCGM